MNFGYLIIIWILIILIVPLIIYPCVKISKNIILNNNINNKLNLISNYLSECENNIEIEYLNDIYLYIKKYQKINYPLFKKWLNERMNNKPLKNNNQLDYSENYYFLLDILEQLK